MSNNFEDFDDGMFAPPPGAAKPNPVPRPVHPGRPQVTSNGQAQAQPQAPQNFQMPSQGWQPSPQEVFASMAAGPSVAPANPLAAYFRAPGISVALPTSGSFMPEGSIAFDMDGKIRVYPMTAADELLLKSPDALMSGFAIEQMLRSCVPSIRNPRLIATPDLDVLLLAVRAASYGEKMEIEVTCPKCSEDSVYDCHLPLVLSTVKELPTEVPVRLSNDVVVYLRPFNLENSTRIALTTFTEARSMQNTENMTVEARTKKMNESYLRMSALSSSLTADSVLQVAVPGSVVTDRAAIAEFMANVPSDWTKKIDATLKNLNEMGLDRTIHATCTSCSHEFDTELQFDPSSFFV